MNFRRSLCSPVPEIFHAAEKLLQAVERHERGDLLGAETCLREANDDAVRAYLELAWGKGATARYDFKKIENAPPYLATDDRPTPRMPNATTRKQVIDRDGYHCRFCGIPVVDPALRRLIVARYPAVVGWGSTNSSQHAAFQCMWLQFDHLLPNSRGGHSDYDNIVIACAACNFGRMEATLEEAGLLNPLENEPPIVWKHHTHWDGMERMRASLRN